MAMKGRPKATFTRWAFCSFRCSRDASLTKRRRLRDLAHLHATAPIPLPSSLNPSVPFSVDALVLQAMAKDPHRRFPSVDAFRDNLQEALAALETIPSPIPPVPAEPPSEKEEATDEEERPVWRQVTQSVLASVIGLIVGLVFVGLLVYSLLVSTPPTRSRRP
jgi:serine/threonine protein kinase